MIFENRVKNIQAAAYNGARTVVATMSTEVGRWSIIVKIWSM